MRFTVCSGHAFLVFLLASLLPSTARAQGPKCSFSISKISFGTVDVKNGRPYDATGTFAYACTGDSREIVRICPSLGLPSSGPRFLTDDAGNKLFFNLYSDESRTTVWGTWYSKNLKAPAIDIPLGRSEKTSGSVTIYARLDPGQQSAPPGIYNSNISGNNSAFAYDYASKGSCDSIKSGGRVSVPVSITTRVGDGSPASQPIVAPDATHSNNNPGSAQVTAPAPTEKTSLLQKLVENAVYQQQKNQGNPAPPLPAHQSSASSSPRPLCKMSDSDVHLVDGTWAGPNCIAVDGSGKPAHPEDVQQQTSALETERRADFIESNSCMTTLGADKATQLADDCTKATRAPHTGCNIQQNTCDEIKDATKHGCDAQGASGPDFCLTRYR
jgi:spore coat protein U-like protein